MNIKNVKFTGSTEQLEKVVEILVGNGYHDCSDYAQATGAIVVYDYQDFQYINSGKQYDGHSYPEQDIEKFIAQHSATDSGFSGLEDAYDEPLITGSPWVDNDGTMPDLPEKTMIEVIYRHGREDSHGAVTHDGLRWSLDNDEDYDVIKWRFHRPEDAVYYRQPKTANSFSVDYANSEGAPIMGYTYTIPNDVLIAGTMNGVYAEAPARNKYMREIRQNVYCDVYDVLRAFNVTDPCLQHLIKKALAVGQRGHKDALTDYKDILASATRALDLHNEWESK